MNWECIWNVHWSVLYFCGTKRVCVFASFLNNSLNFKVSVSTLGGKLFRRRPFSACHLGASVGYHVIWMSNLTPLLPTIQPEATGSRKPPQWGHEGPYYLFSAVFKVALWEMGFLTIQLNQIMIGLYTYFPCTLWVQYQCIHTSPSWRARCQSYVPQRYRAVQAGNEFSAWLRGLSTADWIAGYLKCTSWRYWRKNWASGWLSTSHTQREAAVCQRVPDHEVGCVTGTGGMSPASVTQLQGTQAKWRCEAPLQRYFLEHCQRRLVSEQILCRWQ